MTKYKAQIKKKLYYFEFWKKNWFNKHLKIKFNKILKRLNISILNFVLIKAQIFLKAPASAFTK